MRPYALPLVALVACATASPRAAAPTATPLPDGPLDAGTYTTTAPGRALTFDVATSGVWAADGATLRAGNAAMGIVAFATGATTPDALLQAFRTTPGLTKSADEVTKPVDGNDAWHLTWNVTRDARVAIGGRTFTFTKGEHNHAIVVSAPRAPLLVLMAATEDNAFETVYDEGHKVVFSMRIAP